MKIKSGFILKEIAGENVLMFLDSSLKNKVITLNETGTFIFKLISEGKTAEEITAALLSEYDIDETNAKADVSKFIQALSSIGALED